MHIKTLAPAAILTAILAIPAAAATITFANTTGTGFTFTGSGPITYNQAAIGTTLTNVLIGTVTIDESVLFTMKPITYSFIQTDGQGSASLPTVWRITPDLVGLGGTVHQESPPVSERRPITPRLIDPALHVASLAGPVPIPLYANLAISGIPEPGTLGLMGLALAGIGLVRRRT